MRKPVFLSMVLLGLLMVACQEENKPIMTIDQVNQQWQTATIKKVQSDDVMDMVQAFQKQWPTQSVAMFLEDVKLPEEERQYITEYDSGNAYVMFAEGSDDRDAESMEAHWWQRTNGHKLFAIAFDQLSSEVKAFVAFFDYDPAQKTLTPETSLANFFTPSHTNVIIGYNLPQYGDLLEVNEYFWNWWWSLRHFYEWDGMNFTEPEVVFDGMYEIMDQYYDEYMTYEMGDFSKYALIDIDEDGEPEIWLSTEDEEYQVVLSVVEGKVKILAGKDFKRGLFFYKGVVGDAGGCGTGCYYVQYTKVKDSAPESVLTNMQSYNFETDGVDDEYYKDGEALSNEEGDALVKSFGEPVEPQVKWCKLAIPKG